MPSRCPPLSGPRASRSVSTKTPVGVVKVVSSTRVRSTYLRLLVHSPLGAMRQWPASGPSSRPNTEGESKRGKPNHSIDPSVSIKAHECRSEMRAWSAMAVVDMAAPGFAKRS